MNLTHEIPADFENEERWLKIFTLKSLILCLIAFGIGVVLTKLCGALLGTSIPGIIIGAILVVGTYLIVTLKKDSSDYLKGGGQQYFTILFNRYYRKKFTCIYVLGYNDNLED